MNRKIKVERRLRGVPRHVCPLPDPANFQPGDRVTCEEPREHGIYKSDIRPCGIMYDLHVRRFTRKHFWRDVMWDY